MAVAVEVPVEGADEDAVEEEELVEEAPLVVEVLDPEALELPLGVSHSSML